ncbi:hypothetical protein FDE98_17900 [Clostridium sporogenes]|uniref:Uncharacterized protein n=1 Tax=Clostridium sporogenes TaxID=1509 RepID=A0A7X5PDF3_CLOSG|nr:hypothetical protein [Clostridium sporogenes]AJD29086.1 hypothetical protein T258_4053 [Clostridium botulinum Prevot_594]NFL98413.1 hypothetical protein [Clostridium botulinum]NFP56261.1 hypothetical protein [Clostridium botulinum]NFQ18217.1 hypothetical protein [Clostridium sporogenes]NFQ22186.1 hypothetical protein [Clostridium sporogenes]
MIKRKINTIIKNIQNKFNSRKTSKLIEEDLDKDNINNEELGEFEPMYKYIPKKYWDDLMFMGIQDGMYMYKHCMSRAYINVDAYGNFYINNKKIGKRKVFY